MTPAQAALQVALLLQQRGDLAAAESAYRDLLRRFGPDPDAEHMLGVTLHAAGRSEEALPWFERAAQARSGATFWNNHAAALLAVGRTREAAELARRVIAGDPKQQGAWLNLGLACEIDGDFGNAIAALATARSLSPKNIAAARALARCELAVKNPRGALAVFDALPEGTDAPADLIRAEAMIENLDFASAEKLLQHLSADQNSRAHALSLRAEIEVAQGRSDAALATLREAIAIDPENRRAVVKEASLRIGRGETEAGMKVLRTWLERHPRDNGVAGTYLFACNYSETTTPASLFAEHRRFAPVVATESIGDRAPPRAKLRIGWVRDSFGADLTKIFLEEVLRAFPAAAPDVEHVLYAVGRNVVAPSATPTWADAQHDVSGLSDRQFVERVRHDRIDVLVDLMGRTTGNRIGAFAARAASIQIGWLDVFYPSGLDTMDYLVTDSWLSPSGADAHFGEKLMRLPHGRLAYSPPPVGATNVEAAKLKRFISLNRFSKLNDAVIDVWASILRALPDWALLLKARGRDDDLAARFLARFANAGVDPARVTIEDGGTYAEAMAAYDRASIALDPFPFSGCSTTCDALWMGLPVVTWPRQTIASRQSAAWLEMAGKSDWIAHDADSYVELAVRLANDEPMRLDWRRQARDILRPTICDSTRLAHELAAAIRAAVVSRH